MSCRSLFAAGAAAYGFDAERFEPPGKVSDGE
jgi:hypothetical protein